MKAYKVEIQNLESHIMSLHQPSRLTPEGKYSLVLDSINSFHFLIKENIFELNFKNFPWDEFKNLQTIFFLIPELTMLLRKSHENFLALAALFHQVHESVKVSVQIFKEYFYF